jgi:hypothetical protein
MLASAEVAGIAKPTLEANGKNLRYFLNSGSILNAHRLCTPPVAYPHQGLHNDVKIVQIGQKLTEILTIQDPCWQGVEISDDPSMIQLDGYWTMDQFGTLPVASSSPTPGFSCKWRLPLELPRRPGYRGVLL